MSDVSALPMPSQADRRARDPFHGIERAVDRMAPLDQAARRAVAEVQPWLAGLRRSRLRQITPAVDAATAGLAALDDTALLGHARTLAQTLRRDEPSRLPLAAQAFALVREASARHLGMRHHPVQLMGGYAMLRGWLAEMRTGEGKTLTATLPAAAMALSGRPVHVVTVNDYLAARDAEAMAPLYRALGLSVAAVVSGMTPAARRAAYAADIVYCVDKELAFDHLRDRLAGGTHEPLGQRAQWLAGRDPAGRSRGRLQRGLAFALIDEADSILIDEARTPLILSGEGPPLHDPALLRAVADLVATLEPRRDWVERAGERRVELTRRGARALAARAPDGPLQNRVLREELAGKALTARHLLRRDVHYLLAEDAVRIIDEYTGRIMPDRFWTDGLHQLVELKEGLDPSAGRVTLARTTYQRFFRRYDRLAGMSGTVREVAPELWRVYGLTVVPIPPHRPVRLRARRSVVCSDGAEKWRRIAEEAQRVSRAGGAVLIGARSVEASAQASAALDRAGIAHEVLSAAQDADEARKIAQAGHGGRVTVATNMAGRGADIPLGPGVAERGGLTVILSERHDSARIDRQLAGRAGRQGAPGSVQAILARDDPLLRREGSPLARGLARVPSRLAAIWAQRLAQRRLEGLHRQLRRRLLKNDDVFNDAMAFAGPPE
jgi:preprotein translocase subunit SecA